jgi:gas vesicle protein GvpO/gas vesicle protein GvpG
MFLLDSLLAAPGSAAVLLFKELARKAQEEWLDDDSIKQELQELYTLLESGSISDREFEARECRLLERLEQIARAKFQDKWGPEEAPAAGEPPPTAAVAPPLPVTTPVAALPPAFVLPPPIDRPVPLPALAAPAVLPLPVPIPPPVFEPPPVVTPPAAFAPPPPAGGPLTVFQIIDTMNRSLPQLRLRVSSITSAARDEEGWRVTAELIERKGVPDTNDLLGLYEFRLDHNGCMVRYERTRMRRRGDVKGS